MGEPRDDARRWLAERGRVAYRTCSRLWLTTSHGHRPAGIGPCGDCIADAILNAPGVEVQIAWAPYGPQAGTGLVTVMLPIEAR